MVDRDRVVLVASSDWERHGEKRAWRMLLGSQGASRLMAVVAAVGQKLLAVVVVRLGIHADELVVPTVASQH